jgi:hypothetical protein
MLYFSYGSNMSVRRIGERLPSAKPVAVARLPRHRLVFHKVGKDGSAKCDAAETEDTAAHVIGVVFDICPSGKASLDQAEGLGRGYAEKLVSVAAEDGQILKVVTYYATHINASLKPFHWYKEHVLRGAREHRLPDHYIRTIELVEAVRDPDFLRHAQELAIYRGVS